MSAASTTLLYTIVVKVKTWHMGACLVAACTLLNRVSDGWHRVAFNTDLFIAADDAIEDEGMLEAMLMVRATVLRCRRRLTRPSRFATCATL